ncbi:hypothetical protein SH139x_004846 [Planctomycetaceae bacterium SH139]
MHDLPQPQNRVRLDRRRLCRTLMAGVMAGLAVSQTGCIQFVANMLHAVQGNALPAEFDGLKGQRVAVFAITDTSQYTDDVAARMLTRYSGELLLSEVKDLKLVREAEVEDWRDTQGYNTVDPISLGRGVKADKVVVIEMTNLRLRDGQTMYRGHADVTVSVHDMESGSIEFRRSLEDYTYPATAALPITETTEEKFRRLFLGELAKRVTRHFYPYDFRDSVASDARIVSF